MHEFLGMTLDLWTKGECHILQEYHIKNIVELWPEVLKDSDKAATPASNDLFKRGPSKLLGTGKKEILHSIVANCLFVSDWSRLDIKTMVSVVSGRVREPNSNDWDKCGRLVKYLHSTSKLHLILRYDGLSLVKWHVDAAFGVHMDFKSHSGGMISLHPKGGAIASGRNKQCLNTRSSTEAELVVADDFLVKILWTDRFMSEQGYNLKGMLHQDNRSAMIVAELTRQERVRAQEGLLILNEKWSGRIKGRLAYNGKATREWIRKENKSPPTGLTEIIKLTVAVDAYEKRDVSSMDIPNVFIQTILPLRPDEERVIMKIRGKLVDWLLEIAPTEYASLVVIERGVKVLYLHILRAIYGMIEASLLWYRKFRTDLEKIGFEFNVYDPCVANRKNNNK